MFDSGTKLEDAIDEYEVLGF